MRGSRLLFSLFWLFGCISEPPPAMPGKKQNFAGHGIGADKASDWQGDNIGQGGKSPLAPSVPKNENPVEPKPGGVLPAGFKISRLWDGRSDSSNLAYKINAAGDK